VLRAVSNLWESRKNAARSTSDIFLLLFSNGNIYLWDLFSMFVVKWRDNHVLIFYTIIYYRYAEYTDELQLDDLPVAG
jgi:hypothetical protein